MKKIFYQFIILFMPMFLYGQNTSLKVFDPVEITYINISDKERERVEKIEYAHKIVSDLLHSYPADQYEERQRAFEQLPQEQKELYELREDEHYEDLDPWSTEIIGCSWYCGAYTDTIFASSVLPASAKFNYNPGNLHDFSLRTAWIEGVPGYGIGESITFHFPSLFPVTTFYIYNGYMRTEKTWKENSRVKQLKLYVNDEPYALLNLQDIIGKQMFEVGEELKGKKRIFILTFRNNRGI